MTGPAASISTPTFSTAATPAAANRLTNRRAPAEAIGLPPRCIHGVGVYGVVRPVETTTVSRNGDARYSRLSRAVSG